MRYILCEHDTMQYYVHILCEHDTMQCSYVLTDIPYTSFFYFSGVTFPTQNGIEVDLVHSLLLQTPPLQYL